MSAQQPPSMDVIYLSPRGKRCVLIPKTGRPSAWLEFRYLDDAALAGGGFVLTRENFKLMKEAPFGGRRVN